MAVLSAPVVVTTVAGGEEDVIGPEGDGIDPTEDRLRKATPAIASITTMPTIARIIQSKRRELLSSCCAHRDG